MLTATNSWGTVIGLGNSFFSAANFARPSIIGPKSVPLLPKKYLTPRARRVVYLINLTNPTGPPQLGPMRQAAKTMGITLEVVDVHTAEEVRRALRSIPWRSIAARSLWLG